jgi:Zn-dependent protease with chaperone function
MIRANSDRRLRPGPMDSASRAFGAGLALAALALGTAVFGLVEALYAWRVVPASRSHELTLYGHVFTYPAANADAVILSTLVAGWVCVAVLAGIRVARELSASRRFRRGLRAHIVGRRDGALVVADRVPRAFCAGLVRPRVYISTAALDLLDRDALEAVLAHERQHALRLDPLRGAFGRVLAASLRVLPSVGELVRDERDLAELSADRAALDAAQDGRAALARAMLAFGDGRPAADAVAVDPARVDFLLGRPPHWRFPLMRWLAAVAAITLILAAAALIGGSARASATLAAPFFSARPCLLVLALAGILALLVAPALLRRVHRR